MTLYSPEQLRSFVPDVDHPTLNALRNNLHNKKIDIPVRLYKDGVQVYGATALMFGHGHSLYRAALDAVIEQATGIEWDQAQFHSSKMFDKAALLDDAETSLSTYITAYRKTGFETAMQDVMQHLDHAKTLTAIQTKEAFEQNMLKLCAAIISTSVEVKTDAAYAPVVKTGFRKFLPQFGRK